MVLNGLITTDSLFGVTITQSTLVTDPEHGNEFLQNASGTIYQNNRTLDTLTNRSDKEMSERSYYYYNAKNYFAMHIVPEAGKEYEIEIKYPGMKTVYAKTTIPDKVTIEKLDTTRIKLPFVNEYVSDEGFLCQISFTDPPDEENYYLIGIIKSRSHDMNSDGIWHGDYMLFTCDDAIVEEELKSGSGIYSVAFSDKSINGMAYKLTLSLKFQEIGIPLLPWEPAPYDTIRRTVLHFRLYSINKEYFTYIQELNLFYKNYRNPLAEPTQVRSNVAGGYGFFSGAAVSSDSLVFKY
ncbi:MAG: hypothetical protein CVU09_07510 [Bacteroidetes bacterium HGW-Bacteroidetes-4]|nr:MAG: hypothetical protein CVU09_07510 [Bacteroidetes bacterium HGW-Bacteroidetes-4]